MARRLEQIIIGRRLKFLHDAENQSSGYKVSASTRNAAFSATQSDIRSSSLSFHSEICWFADAMIPASEESCQLSV